MIKKPATKQVSVRMSGSDLVTLEEFSKRNKMSMTATSEFFVRLGISNLSKEEAKKEENEALKNQIAELKIQNSEALEKRIYDMQVQIFNLNSRLGKTHVAVLETVNYIKEELQTASTTKEDLQHSKDLAVKAASESHDLIYGKKVVKGE